MPNTTPDAIPYPDGNSQVAPLSTWFANMAIATQNALSRRARSVSDLNALAAQTSVAVGQNAYVTEIAAHFIHNGVTWVQVGPGSVNTVSIRDSAYAKAAGAYRVAGTTVYVRNEGRYHYYRTVYNASTNPGGAVSAGWYLAPDDAGAVPPASFGSGVGADPDVPPRIYRRNGLVQLVGRFISTGSGLGTGITLGVIPDRPGLRPAQTHFFQIGMTNSTTLMGRMSVDTTGTITLISRTDTAPTYVSVDHISYPSS